MFVKGIMSNFSSSRQQTYKEGYLLPVMEVESLLEAGRHQGVLRQVKESCGLPNEYYKAFYQETINRFVEFVQVLPTDFEGPLCSLMNQGIARAVIALQTYQIEHVKDIDPLKSYAVFTAAMYQDVSHVLINQRIILTKEDGDFVDFWNPFDGSMVGKGEYYRLIRLAPVYERLDYSLRYLFARQLMPEQGYRWIATDLHLLADWFDAISGDSGQGGVLAHMLSLSKHEDIIALQNSLVQVPVKQKEAVATEHGQAFYDWLTKAIARGLIVPNAAESGIYITNQGVFLERHKLFRDFLEIYNQDVALQVVYAQFGNLMGIVKKGGHDFMNAQYFSGSTASTETGARSFGSPIGGQSSSLRDGMVLADPAMILTHNQIPAVSPMLRQMQSKGMSHNNLPVLDSSSAGSVPSPRPDPRKK